MKMVCVVVVLTFTKGTLSSPLPSLKSTKDCTWYIRKECSFVRVRNATQRGVTRIFHIFCYAYACECVYKHRYVVGCGYFCCWFL